MTKDAGLFRQAKIGKIGKIGETNRSAHAGWTYPLNL